MEYSPALKKNYQRVKLTGKFLFENEIYLYSLNDSGKPGFDVITPFKTTKNEYVLVNRGWVKKELKNNLPKISTKKNFGNVTNSK